MLIVRNAFVNPLPAVDQPSLRQVIRNFRPARLTTAHSRGTCSWSNCERERPSLYTASNRIELVIRMSACSIQDEEDQRFACGTHQPARGCRQRAWADLFPDSAEELRTSPRIDSPHAPFVGPWFPGEESLYDASERRARSARTIAMDSVQFTPGDGGRSRFRWRMHSAQHAASKGLKPEPEKEEMLRPVAGRYRIALAFDGVHLVGRLLSRKFGQP